MKRYKYLQISNELDKAMRAVQIASTDAETINWIIAKVKELFPQSSKSDRTFPSGEVYSITLRGLGNEDHMVSWWILKKLSEQGWEVFLHDGKVAHLRLEIANTL